MAERRLDVELADWVSAVAAARDEGYTFFDWLSAVDETDRDPAPGLDVWCHLVDPAPRDDRDQATLLLRTTVPEGAALPSLTGVVAGAAWHERETHEMFGLAIDGFDDGSGRGLRPLLLPEGFEGTPLRKSFVLAARATKPWPGGKEPGEGHGGRRSPSRRRVSAPGVPGPDWGPHPAGTAPTDDPSEPAQPSAPTEPHEPGEPR